MNSVVVDLIGRKKERKKEEREEGKVNMSYENKQACKLTLQILVRGTAPYRKYNGQLHLAQKLNKRTKQ